jgi:hypothetical protein
MYRGWKKIEFPKECYTVYEFGNNKAGRLTKKLVAS